MAHTSTQARLTRSPGCPALGREELLERERGGDPDISGWDECVRGVCRITHIFL
jgi:hypothetical protein